MYVSYDEEGDVLQVQLRTQVGSRQGSQELSGDRFVEMDEAGALSIEFLGASQGIDLDGLPEADAIARALAHCSSVLGLAVTNTRA